MSLNKVMLIGRLGKDPIVNYTQGGTAACEFSVATTEKYKNKQGEWVEKTEWHNILVWAKLGENCGKYLSKGREVYIEGKIQTSSWEKDGITRYITKIVANDVKFLGGQGQQQNQGGYQQPQGQGGYQGQGQGGYKQYPDPDWGNNQPPSDDIPF